MKIISFSLSFLVIFPLSACAASDDESLPTQIRDCILYGDLPRFVALKDKLTTLDPIEDFEPLLQYCQDHHGAWDTVAKLHTASIRVHFDQMNQIIKNRTNTKNQERVSSEEDAGLEQDIDEIQITQSYRPIKAEFISEERTRLQQLSFIGRWLEGAYNRECALDILYTSQVPNVWEHVEIIEQMISHRLANQNEDVIQMHIADRREMTRTIGKTLTDVKEKTWEKVWWHHNNADGYKYVKREIVEESVQKEDSTKKESSCAIS